MQKEVNEFIVLSLVFSFFSLFSFELVLLENNSENKNSNKKLFFKKKGKKKRIV